LGHRLVKRGKSAPKKQYLIHWLGYGHEHDSWEPESNLSCPDLLSAYWASVGPLLGVDDQPPAVTPAVAPAAAVVPARSNTRPPVRRKRVADAPAIGSAPRKRGRPRR
jgi:hypothetical protein